MSISGSMYTGISGLQAQSKATSVVSNNLANSTTSGYKSTSITFEDVFYSTVYAGGHASQVGNGVAVSAISRDFSQGSYSSTNSVTDVALTGKGLYIVVDNDTGNTFYTRDGNFHFNPEGFLVDAHNNRVQGWVTKNGSITGGLKDIRLDNSQSPPKATTTTRFSLNLDRTSQDKSTSSTNPYAALFENYVGTANPPLDGSRYSFSTPVTVFDETGAAHDLKVYYDPVTTSNGSMTWEYTVTCDASEDMRDFGGTALNTTSGAGLLMTGTLTFSGSGELQSMTAFTLSDTPTVPGAPMDKRNWVLAEFDTKGLPVFNANFTGDSDDQKISLNFGLSNSDASTGTGWKTTGGIDTLDELQSNPPTSLPSFNKSLLATGAATSTTSGNASYSLSQDGYAPGVLINIDINENGVLSGSYSNGQSQELFTFGLANFTNYQGLHLEGNNLYSATQDSGQAAIGTAGSAGFGNIASNALEQSNVDTATELTNLIIIQSAYQANSKIITTADTLLQTAIGLKR